MAVSAHHKARNLLLALCISSAVLLRVVGVVPSSAAEDLFYAPFQYEAQVYADYFYGPLQTAVRERCRVVNGVDPPGAYGWYEADNRIYEGADGWTSEPGTRGRADGLPLHFRDADGDGRRDPDEYVWHDVNGNGLFDYGVDIVIAGSPTAANDSECGRQRGFFYHDANGNGQWDPNEDVWQDLSSLPDDVEALHAAVTALIPKFVNHTDNGGSWDLRQTCAPRWAGEAEIVTHCTEHTRVQTTPCLAAWLKQQYEILNLLGWLPGGIAGTERRFKAAGARRVLPRYISFTQLSFVHQGFPLEDASGTYAVDEDFVRDLYSQGWPESTLSHYRRDAEKHISWRMGAASPPYDESWWLHGVHWYAPAVSELLIRSGGYLYGTYVPDGNYHCGSTYVGAATIDAGCNGYYLDWSLIDGTPGYTVVYDSSDAQYHLTHAATAFWTE